MIVSDLTNWEYEKEAFPTALRKGIEYLRDTDLQHLQPGKYEIDGEDMFVMIQEAETALKSERKFESHIKYIDIQYLISGEEEIIGYARKSSGNVITVNELETNDYALYEAAEGEMDLLLKPGMFAVFFPSDLHRPVCSSKTVGTKIKKAVIKVNIALL
jgi:biofilm protein TabA